MSPEEAQRVASTFLGGKRSLTLLAQPPVGLYLAAAIEGYWFLVEPTGLRVGGDHIISVDWHSGKVSDHGCVGD